MKSYSNNLYSYPVPERHLMTFEEHGNKRSDDYFWLNDPGNEKVVNYLKRENEYAEQFMIHNGNLQEKLYNEIIGRIKQNDQTAPYYYNGFYYYNRYEQGKEYQLMCRKKRNLEADEEILLDINELSSGYKLFKVDSYIVSPDNSVLAFAIDTSGDNKFDIQFKNLETGKMLDEILMNSDSSIVWANDSKSFFYTIPNEAMRSYKVMMHRLGTPQNNDIEIYHETDDKFDLWLAKSKSQKYIFLVSESKTTSEVMYIDADKPQSYPVKIQPRVNGLIYAVEHNDGNFYILTNHFAENFRVMLTSVDHPGIENWIEFISYKKQTLIENFEVFRNYIILFERSGGLDHIRIICLTDKSEYYVNFEEEDYSVFSAENLDYDSEIFSYHYTSLKTPLTTIHFNLKTRDKKIVKQVEILGRYNPDNYEIKREFAKAYDGVNIPVSIVYRKGILKNSDNPLLLMGYGSYGLSFNPVFSVERLCLLDRGFIFAIAHIRGGQEMGRNWYEDGKFLKKKNTFLDFISVAEHLISNGYTKPEKLFANGRSAGGMLMGVVANMRPDLFSGIIAEVPWMDVITDMLNSELPLTTEEYEEWGNPNDPEYYYYMLSYSPYDNIKAQNYPAMFLTGGLNDTQVPYWSPAKWVAKLRELKTDNNIILLKIDMDTGHSGNSGRYEQFKATALKYAFILDQLGIS